MKQKTAYLGISLSNRKLFELEISTIKKCLGLYAIDLLVFVDEYQFQAQEEQLMMQTAFQAIDDCVIFIAEVSKKAIGVGVEVGYAKAKQKPIVYIRKATAKHSTTVSGSADFSIIYNDINDLKNQLEKLLGGLKF